MMLRILVWMSVAIFAGTVLRVALDWSKYFSEMS